MQSTVPSTSFRAVFTTSTFGWVRADYAWTPASHKCCGSAPGISSTDSLFMRYQSCRLLSASSAQHAISALSLTAGCQWPTTWHQSVAQHTCDRLDPHCMQSLSCDAAKTLVQAFISSRLDYCNSVLYGITHNLHQRLQSVQRDSRTTLSSTWHSHRDHVVLCINKSPKYII